MSKNKPRPQPALPQQPKIIGFETAPVINFDGSPVFRTMHGVIIQADVAITIAVPIDDGIKVRDEIKVVAQLRATERAWKSLFDSVLGGKKLLQNERESMRAAAAAKAQKPPAPAASEKTDEAA